MPAGTGAAGFGLGLQILRRIGDELLPALGRAEIVGPAFMGVAMLGGVRIDRHAADGVL